VLLAALFAQMPQVTDAGYDPTIGIIIAALASMVGAVAVALVTTRGRAATTTPAPHAPLTEDELIQVRYFTATLSGIEYRLGLIDGRFDQVDQRLDRIDGRIDRLERRRD